MRLYEGRAQWWDQCYQNREIKAHSVTGAYNEKMDLSKPGREILPRIKSDGTLILDFAVSRTMQSKCCLSYSV